MKQKINILFQKISSALVNFYRRTRISRVVFAAFLIFMGFIDDNSVYDNIQYVFQIRELNKEISYYKGVIEESKAKLNELNSSPENLEKFAREQFLMKKANEDIYLVNP